MLSMSANNHTKFEAMNTQPSSECCRLLGKVPYRPLDGMIVRCRHTIWCTRWVSAGTIPRSAVWLAAGVVVDYCLLCIATQYIPITIEVKQPVSNNQIGTTTVGKFPNAAHDLHYRRNSRKKCFSAQRPLTPKAGCCVS